MYRPVLIYGANPGEQLHQVMRDWDEYCETFVESEECPHPGLPYLDDWDRGRVITAEQATAMLDWIEDVVINGVWHEGPVSAALRAQIAALPPDTLVATVSAHR